MKTTWICSSVIQDILSFLTLLSSVTSILCHQSDFITFVFLTLLSLPVIAIFVLYHFSHSIALFFVTLLTLLLLELEQCIRLNYLHFSFYNISFSIVPFWFFFHLMTFITFVLYHFYPKLYKLPHFIFQGEQIL